MNLKCCPFCGGKAEYTEKGNEHIGIKETCIRCKSCSTKQLHKWRALKFEIDRVRDFTVEEWNRRYV